MESYVKREPRQRDKHVLFDQVTCGDDPRVGMEKVGSPTNGGQISDRIQTWIPFIHRRHTCKPTGRYLPEIG